MRGWASQVACVAACRQASHKLCADPRAWLHESARRQPRIGATLWQQPGWLVSWTHRCLRHSSRAPTHLKRILTPDVMQLYPPLVMYTKVVRLLPPVPWCWFTVQSSGSPGTLPVHYVQRHPCPRAASLPAQLAASNHLEVSHPALMRRQAASCRPAAPGAAAALAAPATRAWGQSAPLPLRLPEGTAR